MGRKGKRQSRPHNESETQFIFEKTDQIGTSGAEDDHEFLEDCFVDTGYLNLVQDINDHRQIILGRTGVGKSAILNQLKKVHGDQVIEISPQDLALKYLANSTILQFFSSINVNLDPFYKLLWRHVMTVEILKRHFELHPDLLQRKVDPWSYLKSLFNGNTRNDKQIRESIEYLEEWAEKFWEETELGIKEITTKVESQLIADVHAKFGIDLVSLSGEIDVHNKITDEIKAQLTQRGQNIVSKNQVQDLGKVIMLLDSVLNDRQKNYWIIIDGLDEDWVEEKLRYRLIMTLIQTSREFSKVKNAKAAIAIRRDLIERVFKLTRNDGFQEEKYASLYLPLTWDKTDLIKLLDKRINRLGYIKTQRKTIHIVDVLPRTIDGVNIKDYMTNIATRPRDIINLFNCCIKAGIGKSKLSLDDFRTAEGEYSRSRLRALADEWDGTYPRLLDFTKLFQRRSHSFKVGMMDVDLFKELCLNRETARKDTSDEISVIANEVAYDKNEPCYSLYRLVYIFFRIGLVGIKNITFESECWIDDEGGGISSAEINNDTSVVIHSTYCRALGINP